MTENQNIEFKESWRDEYVKWVCGFANGLGGKLFIGKDDSGKITNLTNTEKLLEDIPNKVKEIVGIIVDVNLHETKEGKFLEIIVEPYPYPVNYKGKYYRRTGSTNQELKGTELNKFLLQRIGKKWDGVPVPNLTIADLSRDTLNHFREKALKSQRIEHDILMDGDELLIENLQLIENNLLKRATVLLFHKNPEKFFIGSYIKIGYFETDDDLIFQDEIHGNIFDQIEKAMDLLFSKYIKAMISYEDITRVEKYEYPKEAVREALLNAIAHKDYSETTPIQISVYKDKIIFWNEGQLPENWTIDNLLKKHPSKPFNPDVANALFRCGYIESWGRGMFKMINECFKAEISPPLYYYDMSGFWVEFFNGPMYDNDYFKLIGLTERQVNALHYIKDKKEITNSEYQKLNNVSRATATRDLTNLTEKYKYIKKIGDGGVGTLYKLMGS